MKNELYLVESSSGSYEDRVIFKHGIFDDYDIAMTHIKSITERCRNIFINRPEPSTNEYDEYYATYHREMEFNHANIVILKLGVFDIGGGI